MLKNYTNQTVIWKAVDNIKDNGAKTYKPTALIPCRMDYGHKLVRDKNGNETVSTAAIVTNAPVNVGDAIELNKRNHDVIASNPIAGLNGKTHHYEIYI